MTGTLSVYSHFLAVLILGAHLVSLIALRPRDVPWKRLLVSISVMGLFLFPLAIFVFTRDHGQLGSDRKFRVSDVYGLFDSFTGGGKVLVLAYFVPCFLAFVRVLRIWSRSRLSFDVWRYAFFLSWLCAPILVGAIISLSKPLLTARYFIICLPALVILTAVGLSLIGSRWIRTGVVVLLIALSGHATFLYYSQPEKEDWRAAAAYVVSHTVQNDGVFFFIDTGRLAFDYYVRRLSPGDQTWKVVFPVSLDWDQELTKEQPEEAIALLPHCCERVWLILSHDDAGQSRRQTSLSIETSLASEYTEVGMQQFRGVQVRLYGGRKQKP